MYAFAPNPGNKKVPPLIFVFYKQNITQRYIKHAQTDYNTFFTLLSPSVMLRNLEGNEVGSELDRCTEHHPFVDLDIRKLDATVKDTLPPNQYHYFSFHVNNPSPLQIRLQSQNGDANMIRPTSTLAP